MRNTNIGLQSESQPDGKIIGEKQNQEVRG